MNLSTIHAIEAVQKGNIDISISPDNNNNAKNYLSNVLYALYSILIHKSESFLCIITTFYMESA